MMYQPSGTHTKWNENMHADTDMATYWQTMARMTGHSVRYLKVRALVRATLCTLALVVPFASAIPLK